MRRFIFIAFVLLVSITASQAWAARYASIVIELKTGKVLHAVSPDARAYPASLTKMMTLYIDGCLTFGLG